LGNDSGDNVGNRDVDLFAIRPTSNGVLEIDVNSFSDDAITDPVNTVLKLFDGHGTVLASNEGVDGPDPLIRISLPTNRLYYVGVSGSGNSSYDPHVLGSGSPGEMGSYEVSVRMLSSSATQSFWDDQIGAPSIKTLSLGAQVQASLGADGALVRGK